MSHQSLRAAILRAFVVGALLVGAFAATACSSGQSGSTGASQSVAPNAGTSSEASQSTEASSGKESSSEQVTELKIKDIKVGTGPEAKAGDVITVDYTGWLLDGTKFDSSVGKQPFTFALGQGMVIQGWDEGVAGMKVGGVRQLIIPAEMGYGAQGSPPVIPPNAPLKFEVKLLGIQGK